MSLDDPQLLRYSRQILLPEIGTEGQQRLLDARVLIIGLGGLGSPVAMYLAAAGVGHLVLSDDDKVELSNLARQIAHTTADIGQPKVSSAGQTLQALNPEVRITEIAGRLTGDRLENEVAAADVVVDCSDNFETRFLLNAACVHQDRPMVYGAAVRMEGQVSVFHGSRPDSPCYRCLYSEAGGVEETCSENGVLAPVVGVIGSLQAMETLKLLTGLPTLTGRLQVWDGLRGEWRVLKLRKDPQCPVCGQGSA
jgi:molybdopterin/thiamine biosynthesis adenylyltransferase